MVLYRETVIQVLSSWATKVSEIGQQALVGAEGAEESQGRKPWNPVTLPWKTTAAVRDLGQQDP